VVGWDHQSPLAVTVVLQVENVAKVRSETGLGDNDEISWAVGWRCAKTNLRAISAPHSIDQGINRTTIDFQPSLIGGSIRLQPMVLIAGTPEAAPPSPQNAASLLWSDSCTIEVEGDGDRFPVAAADFQETGHPTMAPWIVEWRHRDLYRAADDALVTVLNSAHANFEHLRSSAENVNSHQRLLAADIARQLVNAALNHEELDELAGWEAWTLGGTLSAVVQRCFPNATIGEVRELQSFEPGRFEAQLLHALEFAQ